MFATTGDEADMKGEDTSLSSITGDVYAGVENHVKVREVLKRFVREGRGERRQKFGPALDVLKSFK
jgi:hypothetical protein